jgi:hypothetical protein
MSGSKAKLLRKMLSESIGFNLKDSNPISKRIYRRLKKKYSKLNHKQKTTYNISDYE